MISIVFVHFRTLGLEHLDAAWFSLSRQDFTDVGHVIVVDNNTDPAPPAIVEVLDRYPIPVPRILCFEKHGNLARTHSWSVNRGVALAPGSWVFFTRSDFLLDPDCLAAFREYRDLKPVGWPGFITSYCHQMGYDAALSNADALAPHSLPSAPWRTDRLGLRALVGHVPAHLFTSTDKDAGVWLTRRAAILQAGGMNERMVAWGYQQQAFQRALVRHGAEIAVIPEYLFHHQHHWAPRDFAKAAEELRYEATS